MEPSQPRRVLSVPVVASRRLGPGVQLLYLDTGPLEGQPAASNVRSAAHRVPPDWTQLLRRWGPSQVRTGRELHLPRHRATCSRKHRELVASSPPPPLTTSGTQLGRPRLGSGSPLGRVSWPPCFSLGRGSFWPHGRLMSRSGRKRWFCSEGPGRPAPHRYCAEGPGGGREAGGWAPCPALGVRPRSGAFIPRQLHAGKHADPLIA